MKRIALTTTAIITSIGVFLSAAAPAMAVDNTGKTDDVVTVSEAKEAIDSVDESLIADAVSGGVKARGKTYYANNGGIVEIPDSPHEQIRLAGGSNSASIGVTLPKSETLERGTVDSENVTTEVPRVLFLGICPDFYFL
ncbi:hypothetical protein J2S49_000722 [Arcanobacterium wilhelmae]|uniref:Uncharacterized protein n=1 Tax=Arcanobacterium wilhelmae TaxID=1803177 RepID=A0ABT9NBQ6_9ACTO|nr:hypothetical protein [Arcanobacterium wilhelmae]MDP9800646.1 hypothetical protein [Arcanobacterium wilhelmae]WFN90049.1 hypothetical protein P8A24_07595 [Arcanobacterium wilhelmae]